MGDMLGVKGLIVNFVVRRVKKLVPAMVAARPCRLQCRAEGRRRPAAQAGQGRRPRTSRSCNIPAARPASRRARRSPSQRARQCRAAERSGWRTPTRSGRRPANQVFICALPLYHIFALTVNALMGMQQGAVNVLIPNPRDIPGFVKELAKYKFHIFPGLNTLFNALLNNEDFRKLDFSQLVLSLGGGMAIQRGVAERWKKVDRQQHHRGIRPLGDLAGGDRQQGQRHRIHRHDRPAAAVDRHLDPRRRRQRAAAGRGRRDLHPRPAGDGRLLEPAGRDRQGDDAGRLLQIRRHGLHGRARVTPRSSTARRT